MIFSEEQKKIALLLLNEPKTEEELTKQLNIPHDKLAVVLKEMLRLELITKDGYPTKFQLKQEIISEITKRRQISEKDAYKIRIRAIIEMKAVEENLLKKHLGQIADSLKNNKGFTIYSLEEAKITQIEDMYSSFLEINMSVKDFSSIVLFLFYYGPTSIEVLKPARIEFSQFEFQEGLVELSDIFQKYADYLTKHLNKEELEKFNDSLYQ
jgi:predicted transcriptional regulator